jgi:hypothetical protein
MAPEDNATADGLFPEVNIQLDEKNCCTPDTTHVVGYKMCRMHGVM